jgi:hypothetical protein
MRNKLKQAFPRSDRARNVAFTCRFKILFSSSFMHAAHFSKLNTPWILCAASHAAWISHLRQKQKEDVHVLIYSDCALHNSNIRKAESFHLKPHHHYQLFYIHYTCNRDIDKCKWCRPFWQSISSISIAIYRILREVLRRTNYLLSLDMTCFA